MKRLIAVVLASAIAAFLSIPMPACAGLIAVGTRGGLGTNDSIDWGQLGAPFTGLSSPQAVTSTGGLNAFVSDVNAAFERRDQSSGGWAGNFNPGDHLLWTQGTGGPITIVFAKPVSAVGTQIQADFFGPFAGTIQFFNGANQSLGSVSITGDSNSNADNSAIFLGGRDAGIQSVTLSVFGSANDDDFAINQISLRTGSLGSAPEPASMTLFGLGLAVSALRRRFAAA